ncbi:hypothetical protein ACLI4R_17585 [Natrialbaceae archaeon A-chndr2]
MVLLAKVTGKHDQFVRERVRRLFEHGVHASRPHLYDRPTRAAENLPTEERE